MAFDGTIIAVSHDRYFINKLADRVLYLDKNGVTEYLGNYDYYVEKSKTLAQNTNSVAEKAEAKPKVNDYKLRKEQQSNLRKLKTRIKKCEEEMAELDELEESLQQELSSESVANDFEELVNLTTALEQCQCKKNEVYEQWEELQLELEEMESNM